jgi:hypothetical protein
MSKIHADDTSIVILRSLDEIEKFRSAWEAMQWHPNSDIDQYMEVLKASEGKAEPYVMVLKGNSEIRAILVGRLGKISFDIKFGYKTLMQPQVKALTFIYGGYLGDESAVNCKTFIRHVNSRLKSGDADMAYFNSVRLKANLYPAITSVPNLLCRDKAIITNVHWMMNMPSSIDEFYLGMTAKHRYWLKRIPKVLEKEFPGKVKYVYKKDVSDVDCLCEDAEKVARTTYQRSLGVGFKDCMDIRSRMWRLARVDRLRAYIIYVDGQPTAFWIGNKYRNSFHLDYTGFDPDYRKYEVGTILFMKMLEDLAENNNGIIKYIDFGLGDAQYKRRFGDSNWEETSLYAFSPTSKGVLLNMARTCNNIVWNAAVKTLERLKLKDILKRKWRQKLSNKIAAED